MNFLRLGVFTGAKQIQDERQARADKAAAEQRQRMLDDLVMDRQMRGSGYVPDAEAGPDGSLSGRSLDAIVGAATGIPSVGMKDTGTRYGQSVGGYKYDRMSLPVRKQQADVVKMERDVNLDDVLQRRATDDYNYRVSQRPLDEDFKRAQIDQMRARAVAARTPKAVKPKSMPASAIEKTIDVDNLLASAGAVQKALAGAVRGKTNATGRVFGVIKTPTWAKNAIGMGGVAGENTRTLIGNLKATIAKARAGTSMTPTELDLLESYIPNDNDDETTALRKANAFVRQLGQIKANRIAAYQKYGYDEGEQAPEGDDQLPYQDYNP